MKIIHPTQDSLIVQMESNAIWLFGVLLILCSPMIAIFFPGSSSLNCTRINEIQGDCKLVSRTTLKSVTRIFDLNDLQEARLVETRTYQDKIDYSIILKVKNKTIPLETYNIPSKKSKDKLVRQINSFIVSPYSENIQIEENNSILYYIFSLIFLFVGVFLFISTRQVNCNFDKISNQLTIIRQNLISKEISTLSLDEISDIVIEEKGYGSIRTCRISIKKPDNSIMPLTTYASLNLQERNSATKAIKDFMGLSKP